MTQRMRWCSKSLRNIRDIPRAPRKKYVLVQALKEPKNRNFEELIPVINKIMLMLMNSSKSGLKKEGKRCKSGSERSV